MNLCAIGKLRGIVLAMKAACCAEWKHVRDPFTMASTIAQCTNDEDRDTYYRLPHQSTSQTEFTMEDQVHMYTIAFSRRIVNLEGAF